MRPIIPAAPGGHSREILQFKALVARACKSQFREAEAGGLQLVRGQARLKTEKRNNVQASACYVTRKLSLARCPHYPSVPTPDPTLPRP